MSKKVWGNGSPIQAHRIRHIMCFYHLRASNSMAPHLEQKQQLQSCIHCHSALEDGLLTTLPLCTQSADLGNSLPLWVKFSIAKIYRLKDIYVCVCVCARFFPNYVQKIYLFWCKKNSHTLFHPPCSFLNVVKLLLFLE